MSELSETAIEILTPKQMGEADRLTIEGGVDGYQLMESAGQAVATAAIDLLERKTGSGASGMVCILCGPGNNGGDGFVAAQLLEEEGWSVIIGCSVEVDDLKGDARQAAEEWGDEVYALSASLWDDSDIVIDALFGAGLDRPVTGEIAELIDALNMSGLPVLSVDLPSGVEGASGQIGGAAVRADQTVTFFRKKPGHLLYPGKASCGRILVVDIGIDADVLEETGCCAFENGPALWLGNWPEALKPLEVIQAERLADHKFHRGHCLVLSGDALHSGAARLAARAALRAGAGLVTLAPPEEAAQSVAQHVTSIMIEPMKIAGSLDGLFDKRDCDILVAGPALGTGGDQQRLIEQALELDMGLLFDADGITCFAEGVAAGSMSMAMMRDSPAAQSGRLVLTPHEGEFARLFPDLSYRMREEKQLSKLDCAVAASQRSGAVIILKGADTVVASPDGYAVIHSQGIPYLATAGSGDVLAGIVGGLMAQGMPAFDAASAAVWLHSQAGATLGPGLISEDLIEILPKVYEALFEDYDPDENGPDLESYGDDD
ncbi:yjeF C-terminal region, hydroxyethylthiazole kinase-related/yjeF N-terminal region [Cohaesibacter marisflavi]|uniref:Bifunctional NAD(P)H-hydrate repair enzyme n=1 Tax=Cohaesibacter marisflavi TaxID=655353 RepID=A0A1I5FQA4_9HYPH|nr:NAD(P)H-hydrate dehydratase [Cohaesibacter marisflavi]SFO25957.1 yjeF C-terminal region, hydroxyethylthiazole kinase-related/yjeF N-terminal region [Cohaesibacter marisflavi]